MNRFQKLILLCISVFVIFGIVFQTFMTYRNDIQNARERADLNARVYTEELAQDFLKGIHISHTFEALAIEGRGQIDHFEEIAGREMEDYICCIQLAPGGVVNQIYPLEGNEAGLMDILHDETRGPVVQYGVENNVVTMQGPFDLKQGGQGIAIRNPVYLKDENGDRYFWGLINVIIKVPEIFTKTLNSLSVFNYDYALDTTTSPLSNVSRRVAGSIGPDEQLRKPVEETFEAGGCTWTLYVEPAAGWKSGRIASVLIGSIAIGTMIIVMSYLVIRLFIQSKKLHEAAYTDELTGVLSRRGFIEKSEQMILDRHGKNLTAVFFDLDDFKQINDVYGHLAGDQALQAFGQHLIGSFPQNTVIGRTGGDEFCVLILEMKPLEAGESVRRTIHGIQKFTTGGHEISYTISAGYADYPSQASDLMGLMTMADQALYASKLAGKNRSRHYEPFMADIKRTRVGFSASSLAAGIPGAFLIYQEDEKEEILFANDDLLRLTGYSDFDEFIEAVKGSFRNFVHPDDLERVETAIHKQIEEQRAKPDSQAYFDDYVEYRIFTKEGKVKHVIDVGRWLDTPNYGGIFFVFIREKGVLKKGETDLFVHVTDETKKI
jgi:diguanylate cyclase (GGDEF)-like protein